MKCEKCGAVIPDKDVFAHAQRLLSAMRKTFGGGRPPLKHNPTAVPCKCVTCRKGVK
jgi:hypothetical protein